MISFENQIEIARQVEEVFAYVADLENIPAWNYAVERTERVTSGSVGVGTKYLQHRSIPRPAEETIEITTYQPHEMLVVDGTLGSFIARMSYTFADTGGVTVLTNAVDLTPTGPARLVAAMAANRIKASVLNNLGALKRILEHS